MPPVDRYQPITGESLYRQLALGQPLVVLDVRTETEYALHHISGSLLIPLQELEGRIEDVPNGGVPIAVVCEQGLRSVSACHMLAEYGYGPLYSLAGGLEAWPGPCEAGPDAHGGQHHGIAPSSWLVENFHYLHRGLALDLAMGEGRNAIYLATRGFDVDGVERDSRRVAQARCRARKLGAPIRAIVGDVEDGTYILPIETYDLIVVFNYLHRPLFQDIRDGIVPGGIVVYQTYTVDQAAFGPPRKPEHLLERGELRRAFTGWEHLAYRELVGPDRQGRTRAMAAIVARKPR